MINKIFNYVKKIVYALGILTLFFLQVIFLYDNYKDLDIFGWILSISCFYSFFLLISKLVKSTDYLEYIRKIILDKKINNEVKINLIEHTVIDIDNFLNDK